MQFQSAKSFIKFSNIALLLGTLLSGCAFTPIKIARVQGRNLATNWVPTSLDLNACNEKARSVMQRNGFRDIQIPESNGGSGSSTFGNLGDYRVGIRCIPEKDMAFLMVMGEDEAGLVMTLDLVERTFLDE